MPIAVPQIITEDRASGAQVVEGSLKFVDGGKQHLEWTPGSDGNKKTFTLSGWFKRTASSRIVIMGVNNAIGSNEDGAEFDSDPVRFFSYVSSSFRFQLTSTRKFRDNTWYHIVFTLDTTQGTASDRAKIYVNGELEEDLATATYPSQNQDAGFWNSQSVPHRLGISYTSYPWEGFMSQLYFVDGQALDASYFGYTDELTNTWRPKKFNIADAPTVDWGTNGWYLPFDGSRPIGEDQSGRGNHWTPKVFGGSAQLSKATGAFPTLNTMGGGKVALPRARGTIGVAVTVAGKTGGGNAFYFDGVEAPTLNFARGQTVTFDTSDSTVATHPLRFSITSNNSGGSEYTDGRVTSISEGTVGAATTITIPHNAPDTLYYYCTAHSGMGGSLGLRTDVQVADPYAWKNVLSVTGTGITDTSNLVNCTCASKSVTFTGVALTSHTSVFYGRSCIFDGNGDYLSLTSTSDFDFGTDDFTIELWAEPESYGGSPYFFDFRADGSDTGTTNRVVWYIPSSSGKPTFWANGSSRIVADNTIQLNAWTHLALVRSSGTTKMYINGVVQSTTYSDSNDYGSGGSPLIIGQRQGSYASQSFDGHMQDIRVYKGVAKYTSDFIPASTDPDIQLSSPSGIVYDTELTKPTMGSVAFDGLKGYLGITSTSTDFNVGSGDFTIEAWHRAPHAYTPTANYDYIFSGGWPLQLAYHNSRYHFWLSQSATTYDYIVSDFSTGNNSAPSGPWYHVAVTRDGNTFRIFLDGELKSTKTTSSAGGDVVFEPSIGSFNPSSNYYLRGNVSNFRFVKGQALYKANFIPSTTPLTTTSQGATASNVKLLCCQSSNLATAYTVCPQPITISAQGDPTASSTAPTGGSGSVDFDGNDYLILANSTAEAGQGYLSFGTGDFTVELWANADNFTNRGTFYDSRPSGGTTGITFGHEASSGEIRVYMNASSGSDIIVSDNGTFTTGSWYHLAVTRDSGVVRLFINGVLKDTGTPTSRDLNNLDPANIGYKSYTSSSYSYFDGKISNLRVIKGKAIYTAAFTAPTPDLLAIDNTSVVCCQSATSTTETDSFYTITANGIDTTYENTRSIAGITTGLNASSFSPFETSDDLVHQGNESNYCILNYLDNQAGTISGLAYTCSGEANVSGTLAMPPNSGKFYWEVLVNREGGGVIGIGALPVSQIAALSDMNKIFGYSPNGNRYENSTATSYGENYSGGDMISVLYDTDLKTLEFWKNGVTQGLAFHGSDDNSGGVFFDGSNDYLEIADTTDLEIGSSQFTMECFFNQKNDSSSGSGSRTLMAKWDNDGRKEFIFRITDSSGQKLQWLSTTDGNSNSIMTGTTTVTNEVWHHAAVTRDSSGVIRMFLDGVFQTSMTQASTYAGTHEFHIGVNGSSGIEQYMAGMISNVRFIKGTCLYTDTFTPPFRELENIYQTKLLCCQSRTSSTAYNICPQPYGIITTGGDPTASSTAPSGSSGSVDFDGNDKLTLTTNTAFGTDPYTVEFWMYSDTVDQSCVIYNVGTTNGFVINRGSTIGINQYNVGNKVHTSDITDQAWVHYAFVREGTGSNQTKIYKNGTLDATGTDATDWSTTYESAIGGNVANSQYFDGKISNFRIVAGTAVYTSNFTAPTEDLTAIDGTVLLCCQSATDVIAAVDVPTAISAHSNPSPRDCEPFLDDLRMRVNYYTPQIHLNNTDVEFNFGQNPYRYTPPSGYKSLCLSNIPDPEIVRPDQYVGITTWSGAQSGSGQGLRRIPLDFQPDFVWIKQVNQAYTTGHQLYDTVRGAGNANELDTSSDQYMGEGNPEQYGYVQKFDGVGGFTVKGGTTDYDYVDKSGVDYVAWCWKAGGNKNTFNVDGVGYASFAASPLTAGPTAGDGIGEQTNLTVTGCSVGTKQGFSIIRYNSASISGSGNFPHGLNKAPQILITKNIDDISGSANMWGFYYNLVGGYDGAGDDVNQNTRWVTLNQNIATGGNGTGRWVGGLYGPFAYLGRDHIWIDQGSYANVNGEEDKSMISYMWHSVPGLQKFGTFEGNGNADGPYINCGFRPALVICRRLDTANDWQITDDTRSPFNVNNKGLYANLDVIQNTTDRVDYLSNGFKIRAALNENNPSGGTVLYMAWAKTPFNNMYGGQSNAR